jgi:hypothetical protein
MKNKEMKSILQGMSMAKLLEDDDIRKQIVIREELRGLIPPLSHEELLQLEENILAEGVRDPLILWPVEGQFVLVDGHNRFSVCQKHSLKFPFKKVSFKDEEEVQAWMVKNQLGRRNLSKEQQSYLRGLRYHQEKQQGRRVDLTSDQIDLKLESESTAERLAEEYNVSPATIKRDAQFAAGVEIIGKENPSAKTEILKGKGHLKKQDIQAVGQNRKTVDELFQVNQPVEGKRKISPGEVAMIALSFIRNEKRSLQEIAETLGIDPYDHPVEFFLEWGRSINGKLS